VLFIGVLLNSDAHKLSLWAAPRTPRQCASLLIPVTLSGGLQSRVAPGGPIPWGYVAMCGAGTALC